MASVLNEHTQYVDAGGIPLVGGSVYIGIVDTDPVANPQAIFSDRELTVALANPQTLDANGRSTNKIWTDGKFSLQVNDIDAVQVFQDLDAGTSSADLQIVSLGSVLGTNTVTAQATPTITEYVDKQLYTYTQLATNTAAMTLNIDGLGAQAIVKNDQFDLRAAEITADANVLLQYNAAGSFFALINQKTNTIGYREISATDTLVGSDLGSMIRATGPIVFNLPAIATLGEGFSFYVTAVTDTVTITPDGSETIDGFSTIPLLALSAIQITSDGTEWHIVDVTIAQTSVDAPTFQVFEASGTWNKPTGCRTIKVSLVAGGGGGGSANAATETGGGGGGGGGAITFVDVTAISSVTVTIGAGGAGAVSGSGSSGGETTFTGHATASGASGGGGTVSTDRGGNGGSGTLGDFQTGGGGGQGSITNDDDCGGCGGDSMLGGGGRGTNPTTPTAPGIGFGGGGSGAYETADGGDGMDGVVIVEEYY